MSLFYQKRGGHESFFSRRLPPIVHCRSGGRGRQMGRGALYGRLCRNRSSGQDSLSPERRRLLRHSGRRVQSQCIGRQRTGFDQRAFRMNRTGSAIRSVRFSLEIRIRLLCQLLKHKASDSGIWAVSSFCPWRLSCSKSACRGYWRSRFGIILLF